MISVKLVKGSTLIDVSQIISKVSWGGDNTQPHRSITVELQNALTEFYEQVYQFENGQEVRFYVDEVEKFRGYIFNTRFSNTGTLTFSAYDSNFYLGVNSHVQIFRKMTASQIIQSVCTQFGIPVSNITATKYVIPKLICNGMTLIDLFYKALSIERKQFGNSFYLSNATGKLSLQRRNELYVRLVLEGKSNLSTFDFTQSIERLSTQVKVINGDIEKGTIKSYTAKDTGLLAKYGVMQKVVSAGDQKANLQQIANAQLAEYGKPEDEVSVTVVGNAKLVSGLGVYLKEQMTQTNDRYYIITDSHSFDASGEYTVDLRLGKINDEATIIFEEDV